MTAGPDAAAAPKPGETKPAETGAGRDSLIRVAFPKQVTGFTWIGVVIGLMLIVFGYVSRDFLSSSSQSNMVTGIGAGVLLAAFGGQASARFGPFVLAGAVGISAFFVWFLNWSEENTLERRSYYIGTIRDVDPKVFSISLRNKGSAYSRLERKDYNFVAPRSEFEEGFARIEFEVKERDRVPYCREKPADEDCVITFDISGKIFQEAAKQEKALQWRFNAAELQLYDIESNKKVQDTQLASAPGPFPLANVADLVSMAAHAQEPLPIENPRGLASALNDLTSDDIDARRVARDTLGDGPLSWVTPIADRLTRDFAVYRVKLGCTVALAQMLRQNKKAAANIQGRLSERHLGVLLEATGDSDRTVRVYAGEFLFDLADPRSVLPALDLAMSSEDDNARFNYILVARGAIGFLDAPRRTEALRRLEALAKAPGIGPKTREQIALAVRQAG